MAYPLPGKAASLSCLPRISAPRPVTQFLHLVRLRLQSSHSLLWENSGGAKITVAVLTEVKDFPFLFTLIMPVRGTNPSLVYPKSSGVLYPSTTLPFRLLHYFIF